jgi:hypothetical protein
MGVQVDLLNRIVMTDNLIKSENSLTKCLENLGHHLRCLLTNMIQSLTINY